VRSGIRSLKDGKLKIKAHIIHTLLCHMLELHFKFAEQHGSN